MTELSHQAAISSGSSKYFPTQHQPDADPCTRADQNEIVLLPGRAGLQTAPSFIDGRGRRIVFDNYRYSFAGIIRVHDGKCIRYRDVAPAQMRGKKQLAPLRVRWARHAHPYRN